MKHVTQPVLVLALSTLAGACVEADDELEALAEESQELNGTWFSKDADCQPYTQTLSTVMSTAESYLKSPALADCLENAVVSYTEPYFPEVLVRQLNNNQITELFCDDLPSGQLGWASIGVQYEAVHLDLQHLDSRHTQGITSTVLHEISHNKGYDHPDSDDATLEYNFTVPRQIQECFDEAFTGAAIPEPHGRRRDQFTQETTLAPSGWSGGNGFERRCGDGKLAVGLKTRSGDLIDAVGLQCRAPGGIAVSETTLAGGAGGNASTRSCPTGQVMIGVWGRAAENNNALGAICASEADVKNGVAIAGTRQWGVGGGGGYAYDRLCPTGMAVRALRGKAGTFVDKLELVCQRVDDPEAVIETALAAVGATSGGTTTLEKCVGRSSMTGLISRSGYRIDRLGGECEQVTTMVTPTNTYETVDDVELVLPSHGGAGGTAQQDECPNAQALVGIDTWTTASGVLVGVQGYCAPAAIWTGSFTSPTAMTRRGVTVNATLTQHRCPAGQLLEGWTIRADADKVLGLQPVCRNFVN